MQNNTPSAKTSSRDGCLKKFLIIFGIAIVLLTLAITYVFDQMSGNADKRFEKKENARLAKEILPEEYKSYPDLYELESTDEYEVIPLVADFSLYYILPDKTLILAEKFGANFLRINSDGEITDHYYNPDLKFYGTSLMQYSVLEPTIVNSDNKSEKPKALSQPKISGIYSNWPINGDTTLFEIQPIEKIMPTKKQKIAAYDKADVVTYKYTHGYDVEEYAFLHIEDAWYISDYKYEGAAKRIYTERETLNRWLKYFSNITIKYKKRNEYNRAQSAGYLSGGMINYDEWRGDIYLSMKVGKADVLFKTSFQEDKENPVGIRIYFDLINMGNYVVINNFLIRQRKK